MNLLEYYTRQKEIWSDKEIQDIRNEYETNEMTISQIADIHRRTPGSISYKLKNLGLITHNTLSRGYVEYKNSNLYKEIVETGKKKDTEKKIDREAKLLKRQAKALDKDAKLQVKVDGLTLMVPFKEVVEIKNEIAELRKDIKEILRLMNALYDFENE